MSAPAVGSLRVADRMTKTLLGVAPDDPARAALEVLQDAGVRHVLVLEGTALRGILSDRDLIRITLANAGRVLDIDGCRVRDIMTPAPLITTTPEACLSAAARLMHLRRIGALPVLVDGRAVGMLTSDDVLAAVAGERAAGDGG